MRGSVNKPEYVIYTLKKIAETLNMDYEKLGDITYENISRLASPYISIHTSPKGGDEQSHDAPFSLGISIHTSPKGGDPSFFACW